MPVYVDPLMTCLPTRMWRWRQVSHMYGDAGRDELHPFARRLGLTRSWFQPHARCPHYDLTARKRERAVLLGAVEHTRNEAVAKWRELAAAAEGVTA